MMITPSALFRFSNSFYCRNVNWFFLFSSPCHAKHASSATSVCQCSSPTECLIWNGKYYIGFVANYVLFNGVVVCHSWSTVQSWTHPLYFHIVLAGRTNVLSRTLPLTFFSASFRTTVSNSYSQYVDCLSYNSAAAVSTECYASTTGGRGIVLSGHPSGHLAIVHLPVNTYSCDMISHYSVEGFP